MVEKSKIDMDKMLGEQSTREEERFQEFTQNMDNYAKRFRDPSFPLIKKECYINSYREMSNVEREKLISEWKELSGCSDIQVGKDACEAFNTYEKYLEKTLALQYNVEKHCDRFIHFLDEQLNECEQFVEADSI